MMMMMLLFIGRLFLSHFSLSLELLNHFSLLSRAFFCFQSPNFSPSHLLLKGEVDTWRVARYF